MKKKLFIFFILIPLICGCSKWTYNPDKYELIKYEAFIAYVFNGHAKFEPTPDPINPDKITKCDKCDKNRKVLSGDGLIKIPCPCGKECKCHEEKADNLTKNNNDLNNSIKRQIYYFGHDKFCQACIMTKKEVFPKLTSMNPPWKIGEEDNNSIRIFEWNQDLSEEYKLQALPTYILFENGKEIARHVGYIDHIKLSHFYYTGDINKKAVQKYN